MMSDLTLRLRDRYLKHSQELRDDAADRIEELEAALHGKGYEIQITSLQTVIEQQQAEIKKLKQLAIDNQWIALKENDDTR